MAPGRLKLGVNIDHVATIREARHTNYPDIVEAALAAEAGGADSITMHLREDRRHIQDADIFDVQERIATHLNLELAATAEMTEIACRLSPRACCIVPERREELTTEGGLNVAGQLKPITAVCSRLADQGIEVSLFIDPDERQIEATLAAGAPTIEIHTGKFAETNDTGAQQQELDQIGRAVQLADSAGLRVNAGHGLHYHNVQPVAALTPLDELNIGHAIVARALFVGLSGAVAEMRDLLDQVRP